MRTVLRSNSSCRAIAETARSCVGKTSAAGDRRGLPHFLKPFSASALFAAVEKELAKAEEKATPYILGSLKRERGKKGTLAMAR